ncbi:MAG: hypothetical protein HUJ29_05300 [Gammaproteobacteria bacterium]|nr:hypothetical protein [Gammaproteobacteria bacterium]
MRNTFLLTILSVMLALTSQAALAEKKLSKAEAEALFTDKTFDGVNEKKNREFRVYSSPDGEHIVVRKGKTKEKEWRINDDGQHCVTGRKEKCADVIDMGNGVYHKIRKGKHTHTLSNFQDGNQL